MLKSKQLTVGSKEYTLYKFPAWEGILIASRLPPSLIPKIGEFEVYKEVIAEILSYVGVTISPGNILKLSTSDLVNNHIEDWEHTFKLLMAMIEYNCSFFQDGRLSSSLDGITERLPAWISKILVLFAESSSPKEKQPLTSSEQSMI